MGRKATGKWIDRAGTVALRLRLTAMHERDDHLREQAEALGVNIDKLRHWVDCYEYLERALAQSELKLTDVNVSLTTLELLRRWETVNFNNAHEVRDLVLLGGIRESELRTLVEAERADLATSNDAIENVPLETLIFLAAQRAETAADLMTVAAWRKLSRIGERAKVDAEEYDKVLFHEQFDYENPYRTALIISPRFAAARHVGSDFETIVTAVWKACLAYNKVVVAVHSSHEMHIIKEWIEDMCDKVTNIVFVTNAEIREAVQRGW